MKWVCEGGFGTYLGRMGGRSRGFDNAVSQAASFVRMASRDMYVVAYEVK